MREETLEERNEYLRRRRGHKLEDFNSIIERDSLDTTFGDDNHSPSHTLFLTLELLLYHSRLMANKKQSLAYMTAYQDHINYVKNNPSVNHEIKDLKAFTGKHEHKVKGFKEDIAKYCK